MKEQQANGWRSMNELSQKSKIIINKTLQFKGNKITKSLFWGTWHKKGELIERLLTSVWRMS